jgi:hypothetical protein
LPIFYAPIEIKHLARFTKAAGFRPKSLILLGFFGKVALFPTPWHPVCKSLGGAAVSGYLRR